MAKFKPVRSRNTRVSGPPQGALTCVVLVIAGVLLLMVFLYFAMRG